MNLHFIFPRWQKLLEDHPELEETLSGYDIGSFKMVGLGAAAAAGAVPPEHMVTLTDQNIEELDYSIRPDLLCLGFFTPQAENAYRIADEFRRRGVRVVAGGIHPTMVPDETQKHFDCLVRGPVEGLWPEILADLENGCLKPRYNGSFSAPFASPRRDLFSRSKYLQAGVIQTARGCSCACPFCVLPQTSGEVIYYRPISEVLEDIKGLAFPCFFFADENLLFGDRLNLEYTEELLRRMIEARVRKISFVASYPQFLPPISDERAELFVKALLKQIYLVLGLKRPLCEELSDNRLIDAVKRLQRAGVEVLASFNLGHDEDCRPVEPLIEDFCRETGTNLAEFIINTPFPGTPLFQEYEKAGRILTTEWGQFNGANVVFQPRHESAESLRGRYLNLWQWFYAPISRAEINQRYVRAFGGGVLRQTN